MNLSREVFRYRMKPLIALFGAASFLFAFLCSELPTTLAQNAKKKQNPKQQTPKAKANALTAGPNQDREFEQYGIFKKTAPRASKIAPVNTALPLDLKPGERIALIGNTLFEREQLFGHVESLLHLRFPQHRLVVRNLSWAADTIDLQPRPENFADLEQHLVHEKIDVVIAAFGFNESFAGDSGIDSFRKNLTDFITGLKEKSFNGRTAPRLIFLSPIANENVTNVAAADQNNARIQRYGNVIQEVARQQQIGFVNVFQKTQEAMRSTGNDLTINGCHLNEQGNAVFANALYEGLFGENAPAVPEALRHAVIDKDRQFFRRYRPLNTFYYTGDRNKEYGYLDFLPAMRNFEIMVANRDQRIWDLV